MPQRVKVMPDFGFLNSGVLCKKVLLCYNEEV